MNTKRRWTAEEKLAILQEAEEFGVTATIRKHGVYSKTFYEWKDRYERQGLSGLQPVRQQRVDPHLKELQDENRRLKELLAEKELALRIKDDLLKKTTLRKPIR